MRNDQTLKSNERKSGGEKFFDIKSFNQFFSVTFSHTALEQEKDETKTHSGVCAQKPLNSNK
jgi:hypothetical protein